MKIKTLSGVVDSESVMVPITRDFRDAWDFDGKTSIIIDLPTAKAIRKEQVGLAIATARSEASQKLNNKPAVAAIDAINQAALETAIDAASSVEDLLKVWPPGL